MVLLCDHDWRRTGPARPGLDGELQWCPTCYGEAVAYGTDIAFRRGIRGKDQEDLAREVLARAGLAFARRGTHPVMGRSPFVSYYYSGIANGANDLRRRVRRREGYEHRATVEVARRRTELSHDEVVALGELRQRAVAELARTQPLRARILALLLEGETVADVARSVELSQTAVARHRDAAYEWLAAKYRNALR